MPFGLRFLNSIESHRIFHGKQKNEVIMRRKCCKIGTCMVQWAIIGLMVVFSGCENAFVRSGYVVDKQTKEPIEGVLVEIYMKSQMKDSLKEKVFTNENGYFQIDEKRDKNTTFILEKAGYIGYVNSLIQNNDTIFLEKADIKY
jgi:5-hydroxyisourate hydrolase-like protein (transthyretin family)